MFLSQKHKTDILSLLLSPSLSLTQPLYLLLNLYISYSPPLSLSLTPPHSLSYSPSLSLSYSPSLLHPLSLFLPCVATTGVGGINSKSSVAK